MAKRSGAISERQASHLARLSAARTKHGLCDHPLYEVWRSMRRRCSDENDADYGARGIRVCDAWLTDFSAFFSWAIEHGWKKGLHIDRCDTNGNYEPGNCQFLTQAENNKNRRNTAQYTGKQPYAPTYQRPRTSLTVSDVTAIRERAAAGESHTAMAANFGVSTSLIGRITRREQWKNI